MQDREDGEDMQDREDGEDMQDREDGEDMQDREDGEDMQDREDGEDMQDGEDGEDMQDREDGEDMQDREDGEDMQDGEDGEDMQDGEDGEDMQDGEDGEDMQDGEDIVGDIELGGFGKRLKEIVEEKIENIITDLNNNGVEHFVKDNENTNIERIKNVEEYAKKIDESLLDKIRITADKTYGYFSSIVPTRQYSNKVNHTYPEGIADDTLLLLGMIENQFYEVSHRGKSVKVNLYVDVSGSTSCKIKDGVDITIYDLELAIIDKMMKRNIKFNKVFAFGDNVVRLPSSDLMKYRINYVGCGGGTEINNVFRSINNEMYPSVMITDGEDNPDPDLLKNVNRLFIIFVGDEYNRYLREKFKNQSIIFFEEEEEEL
jgi:hypothetical protein